MRKEAVKEYGYKGKRAKREPGEEHREERRKPVQNVLRRDPNTMEVDKYKERQRCFKCGEVGHIAARCTKPGKRKEEAQVVKKEKDFC